MCGHGKGGVMSGEMSGRNKRKTGSDYELLAARYLEAKGYRILEHSFRCRSGEIDLIAWDPQGYLVFAEVKYRAGAAAGRPEEAVTPAKQRTISRVADYYRVRHQTDLSVPCRFDVIAIEKRTVRHNINAFPYAG